MPPVLHPAASACVCQNRAYSSNTKHSIKNQKYSMGIECPSRLRAVSTRVSVRAQCVHCTLCHALVCVHARPQLRTDTAARRRQSKNSPACRHKGLAVAPANGPHGAPPFRLPSERVATGVPMTEWPPGYPCYCSSKRNAHGDQCVGTDHLCVSTK